MPKISKKVVEDIPIIIPEIELQHIVVSKVNTLISLCDQLSARLQASQTTQLQLAEALVEGALN